MIYVVIVLLNLVGTCFDLNDATSIFELIIQVVFRSGAPSVFMCAVVYYLRAILENYEQQKH